MNNRGLHALGVTSQCRSCPASHLVTQLGTVTFCVKAQVVWHTRQAFAYSLRLLQPAKQRQHVLACHKRSHHSVTDMREQAAETLL